MALVHDCNRLISIKEKQMITITLQNFEQVKELIKFLADQDYDFDVQLVNDNPIKAQVGFENGATLRHMLANLNK